MAKDKAFVADFMCRLLDALHWVQRLGKVFLGNRVKFYTQEIVFFCQDLLYRMRRSSLIPPSTEETSNPFEHIVLGDRSEQKVFKYIGITCFNLGSFSHDITFAADRPCTQEVEMSAIES